MKTKCDLVGTIKGGLSSGIAEIHCETHKVTVVGKVSNETRCSVGQIEDMILSMRERFEGIVDE